MSLRLKAVLGGATLAIAITAGYFLGSHLAADRARDQEMAAINRQITAIQSQAQTKVAAIEKKKSAIHVAAEAVPVIQQSAQLPEAVPLISDPAQLQAILAIHPQLPTGPLAILSEQNAVALSQRLLTCEQQKIELDACLDIGRQKDRQIELAKGGSWLKRTAKPLAIGAAIGVVFCAASGKCQR